MIYLLLLITVAASGGVPAFYRRVSQASQTPAESALYPVLWFGPLAIVFGLVALVQGGAVTPALLGASLLAGVSICLAAFSLLESLKRGSYSLAVIVVNLNFYVPVLLSWAFLGEQASLLQALGIALFTFVIVFINWKRGEGLGKGLGFALLSCLGNGLLNFAIKLHQHRAAEAGEGLFYLFAYGFAALCCAGLFFYLRRGGQRRPSVRGILPPALMIGACNGACFLAMGLLAGLLPAAVQFPLVTCLSLLLSLCIGWLRYRERVTAKGLISLGCCLACIGLQVWSLL